MATLSDEVKTFIVQRLAMYDTPQQVADAVKEQFGISVLRQHVNSYNPDRSGRPPAKKWCDLHAATRAAFLKRAADIPAAHRAVRVMRLERIALRAEQRGNYPLAMTAYEQIAKEMGRAYTNLRVAKVQGDAEHPIVFVPATGGKPVSGRRPTGDEQDST